ncbi:large ribosomal subunit protein bL19m [Paramormyrops kingsleyae]|uniref:Large ribosomal subunit protein bL19m n=1 Tax=Paramormyrops kingsleyae TaxID=1676925 RepID=A0A3B3RP00_9TELE|nr:39S ribosomal protein L19, mitochondrial [Paramormyrops kingsleyae]
MAACSGRTSLAFCALRAFRNAQHWNERFFSTSLLRHASGGNTFQTPEFIPPTKPVVVDKTKPPEPPRKFLSPEFIPPRQRTNPLKFAIERKDMTKRRKMLNIPEFYVGSVLAVTMHDPYASGKSNRFVGICIQRSGSGLGATFILRNIIDGQGVEMCYELYSPRIQQVEVLKLEKRLDDNLMYLRDALPAYSTVDVDMKPVPYSFSGEVPVNTVKVRMKPKPWSKRWEHPKFNVQGIRFEMSLTSVQRKEAKRQGQPWHKYDMLKEYDTAELQESIWKEVQKEMSQ